MSKVNNKLRFIDLFAGIGGFHLALHELGMECVFASEIDEKARITYEANFKTISPNLFEGENQPLFNKDITKIDPKDIPDHDILCGGFPCQPFSIAGYRKGFDDKGRGDLIFNIIEIIKAKQPKAIFLENVKNLFSHDQGKTYQYIKELIQKEGYFVTEKVLNASSFGVPTARERLYIVGFKNPDNFHNFHFPKGVGVNTKLIDFLEKDNAQTTDCEIVRDDIVLNNINIKSDIFGNFPQRPLQIGKINKGGQGERIYSSLGHAITLSAHGGGAAAKTGAYLVDDKIRKLTVRECANIMGFPKDFKLPVTNSQAYKQFGNSVVVPVILQIAKKIQQSFETQTLWVKTTTTAQILDPKLQEMVF